MVALGEDDEAGRGTDAADHIGHAVGSTVEIGDTGPRGRSLRPYERAVLWGLAGCCESGTRRPCQEHGRQERPSDAAGGSPRHGAARKALVSAWARLSCSGVIWPMTKLRFCSAPGYWA